MKYYFTNNKNSRYIAKFCYLVVNRGQRWGVALLVKTTRKEITEYIGINIILTMWYIYVVAMLQMDS